MRSDERARHRLHTRLGRVLGQQEAGTLMEYLPPYPWNELATRQDLRDLEERLDYRFDALSTKIESVVFQMRSEFREGLNAQLRWMLIPIGSLLFGIFVAVLRLG